MKVFILLITVLTVQCVKLDQVQKKALIDTSLIQTQYNPYANFRKSVALDIGGRFFDAMKTGKDYLNKKEFADIIVGWYRDHGTPLSEEEEKGIDQIWKALNPDDAVSISSGQLFQWMFQEMDENKDGLWSYDEIKSFIHQYAEMLHRNMNEDWEVNLKKRYDQINFGVSARELNMALSKDGKHIGTFKDFMIDHSTPKKKGLLDPFELAEFFYKALDASDAKNVNQQQWVDITHKYFRERHHHWNSSTRAEAIKLFNKVDAANGAKGTVDARELYDFIFDSFDRNGDKKLNDTEI